MNKRSATTLAVLFLSAVPAFTEEKANPQIVKFPDLAKIVQENRGKVVVVDLWAEW